MNTTLGMRRAKKSGRWMATAPVGYKNSRDGNNKPLIVPDKNAELIVQAFKELAVGYSKLKKFVGK